MDASGIFSMGLPHTLRTERTADRTELTLAIARAFLATGFVLVVHFRPPESRPYPGAATVIAAAYVAYTLSALLLAGTRLHHGSFFRLGTQVIDVVWPLFIPWLAAPYSSLVTVFQLYAVMGAACRWGLWQTLATAGSNVFLVVFEAALVNSGWLLAQVPEQFQPGLVASRAICLLMVAAMIGYLVEQEKRRWATSARSAEQVRLGRELHDGVVQSLAAAEMRLEVLRRQAAGSFPDVADEMAALQQILRHEMSNIRQLIEELSAPAISPDRLIGELSGIVDRFRQETGISAEFRADADKIALSPPACFEIVRIVQEALANVMKHSGAQRVVVRLALDGNFVKLLVEDDGQGFSFEGRLSQADLDATILAPKVIQERVRSIGGELAIESIPGRCARLEIQIPHKIEG